MMLQRALRPSPTIFNNAAVADQRLAVSSSVVFFVTTFNASTTDVFIDVQDAEVMVTFDGSDPSASNGHRLPSGYREFWSKAMAQAARFIRQGASDAAVQVSEFQV